LVKDHDRAFAQRHGVMVRRPIRHVVDFSA
jgi:hypothetical protein